MVQDNGSGGSGYVPDRVLIIDGDLTLMYAIRDALLSKNPSAKIDVLTEEENLVLPEGTQYDLVLLEDHHDDNLIADRTDYLIDKIRKEYPDSSYVLFSTEQNRSKLASRAVYAAKNGALHYFYKPEREEDLPTRANDIADSIMDAYNMRKLEELETTEPLQGFDYETVDNQISLAEIEDKIKQPPVRSKLVASIEEDLEQRLGSHAKLAPTELKDCMKSWTDPQLLMAAYCKLAIMSFYEEGKIQQPLSDINDAIATYDLAKADLDPSLKTTPLILRGQIMNSLSRSLAEESHQDYRLGITRKSPFTRELIEQVEQNVTQFDLKRMIKPTRGNVSVARIGEMECYRREDPSEDSVKNEASVYRFYRRIGRLIEKDVDRIQVPEVLGVVPGHDRSGWVLYREHLKGSSVLDEMRRLRKAMHVLGNQDDEKSLESLEKKKQLQTKLLVHMASQCAYFLACSPVSMAESIKEPVEDYYEPRLQERILDPFDRLFAASGVKGITVQERTEMANATAGLHKYLASLPAVFYKDFWFANTIIRKRGRGFKLFSVDFASLKQLPISIDLATMMCYGGYVNPSVRKMNPDEQLAVEQFYISYANGVSRFNELARTFRQDKKKMIVNEILQDIEDHPTETRPNLEALLRSVQEMSFERHERAFGKLRKKVKRKQVRVSLDYIRDLEKFVSNLDEKSILDNHTPGTAEYAAAMPELMRQYQASLFHRSMLLAGTPCDFILSDRSQELQSKNYLFLSEMMGTLRNAVRGVKLFYDSSPPGKKGKNSDVSVIMRIVGNILNKVHYIYDKHSI